MSNRVYCDNECGKSFAIKGKWTGFIWTVDSTHTENTSDNHNVFCGWMCLQEFAERKVTERV